MNRFGLFGEIPHEIADHEHAPYKLTFSESRKETIHLQHTLQIFEFDPDDPVKLDPRPKVLLALTSTRGI